MAKKKKAPQLDAWCWYCDREFEDEKARHFKCHLCPRRLNTAGGLAVHLGQNTLPGRASFDIEIYGMVGVPDGDLREWMARKGARQQQQGAQPVQHAPKRPRIDRAPLSAEQLRAQLEAHKALMNGIAPTAPVMYGVPSTTVQAQAPVAAPGPEVVAPAPAPEPVPSVPQDAPPAPLSAPEASVPQAAPVPAPVPPVVTPVGPPPPPPPPAAGEPVPPSDAPPAKKARLAYTDTELHPDEKRAQLPRYAYRESAPHAGRPSAAELF